MVTSLINTLYKYTIILLFKNFETTVGPTKISASHYSVRKVPVTAIDEAPVPTATQLHLYNTFQTVEVIGFISDQPDGV